MTQTLVFLTAGTTTWTVPAGITSLDSIECIGPGGAGADSGASGTGGGGGGGGAYAKLNGPYAVTPAATINTQVGAGGFGATPTWFNSTSTVKADFGVSGQGTSGGAGGLVTNCVGDVKYAGGAGSFTTGNSGGGGGGAAGLNGAGASSTLTTTGGAGDATHGGTGGAANAGGGNGTEYDSSHGSGGGGGGSDGTASAGAGGHYGGGGGGNDGVGLWANGTGGDGLIVIAYTSSHAYTQSCLASTNGLATAAKGGARAAPASSAPLTSALHGIGAIRRATSSPLTSALHAMGIIRRASSSPTAILTRSAGAIRRASSSPVAAAAHSPGKVVQASTALAKSLRSAMAVIHQASTTPAKSVAHAIAHALPRATFPVGSLALANAAIRQAASSPLATDTRSAAKVFQGSSSPIASSAELKTALQSVLASSTLVASLKRGAARGAQLAATVLTSAIRIRNVALSAISSPFASADHVPGKMVLAATSPIAFAIPGKPRTAQASTAPTKSLLQAMSRTIGIRTPFIGSAYFIGKAASSSGSGLSVKTVADIPANSLIVVIAAQYGGQFSSVSDPAGSGYLGTDANATTTPIYSTVFYASAAADILAGAVINLFSAITGQARSAAILCVPLGVGLTIDAHGNFNAANGTTPSASTGPLAYAGEIAIGYTVTPTGLYAQAPGFSSISDNNSALGLHVASQTSGDLNALTYAPTFNTAQDYGINVITLQTGWTPTASVTRSLAHSFALLVSAVSSLVNQGAPNLQAASSPVASESGSLVASAVENVSITVAASLQSAMSFARQIAVTVIARRTASTGKTVDGSSSPLANLNVLKVVISLLPASTSPIASGAYAAKKAVLKAVAVIASRVSAMTKSITITTTQIASGSRSFVSTFGASSSPVASLIANIVNGLKLSAATSALASLIRGAGKIARAQTAPVASEARAAANSHTATTEPAASSIRSIGKPIATVTTGLASMGHAIGHGIQALAGSVVATVKRTVPALPFATSTAPVASGLASPLRVKILQASAGAVATLATVWRFFGRRTASFMRGRKV